MDTVKNVFSRLRSIWTAARYPSEEEKARNEPMSININRRLSAGTADRATTDNMLLEEFRLLVGIKQHPSFRASQGMQPGDRPVMVSASRTAPNMGIYAHIVDQEQKCRGNYKFFSRLINVCLGLQLVVAAALTAIGAANGSHGAVTAFGAINTVLAGVMTFLKGSGLPNRLKYFQHEWSSLREYIEQRERDIICGYEIDLQEEIEKIRSMYETVKTDVEANTPDRFVSSMAVKGGNNNASSLATASRSRTPSVLNKLGSESDSDAIHRNYMQGAQQQKKSGIFDRIQEVGDLEKRVEAYGSEFLHEKQRNATNFASNTVHAGQDQIAKATQFGSHLFEEMHGLKSRLEGKLREVSDLEVEIAHHGHRLAEDRRRSATASPSASQLSRSASYFQSQPNAAARAAAENETAARNSLAQTADAATTAIAQRHEAAVQQATIATSAGEARDFAHETIDARFDTAGAPAAAPTSQEEKKEG